MISATDTSGSGDVVVVGAVVVVVVVVDAGLVVPIGAGPVAPAAVEGVVVDVIVVVVRGTDVVVDSKTCSGAFASWASPRKMARIAFMLSPASRGISTAAPPIV